MEPIAHKTSLCEQYLDLISYFTVSWVAGDVSHARGYTSKLLFLGKAAPISQEDKGKKKRRERD